MRTPGWITVDQLGPRGGNHVIVVPKEPYFYNPKRAGGTPTGEILVNKFKTVTLRFPSWYRMLTIMWALTNLIKSKEDWPRGFYNKTKRRFYPMPTNPIELRHFSLADVEEPTTTPDPA